MSLQAVLECSLSTTTFSKGVSSTNLGTSSFCAIDTLSV